ncbi:MAG: undecaprenyl-diphosphate phosphatase [Christensenella sp.]|uniref:undecaprenyl-diphosphate phosphatase n=1 Tax=Christensenella sp. TaxID=1935934 RepID=UPI002B1EA5EB|nr:undecaprenyl-diphosphate phosphatase [Christensenella sp.]MEA5002169.1 undecaprenyl-diphosphate phosphatase [Christensenella sp.]
MDFLESIILGAVQGFTEFLPVSSSGHLTLLQGLMGLSEVPILYDVMLHVGTLIAVFIVLWPEIVAMITHPVKNKLGMLILATIPAVVVTLIAEKVAPAAFADILNGKYLAVGFFATTGVLVLCELIARRQERKLEVELPQAMAMGLMQAAALLPGLSRSGSTIAGGLFTGVGRESAAKFAFLMSIPAILGGVVFGAKDVADNGMGNVSIPMVLVGLVVSAVCGFIAIKFMLRLISRHKLYGFAAYTAVIGVVVLVLTNANPTMFIS